MLSLHWQYGIISCFFRRFKQRKGFEESYNTSPFKIGPSLAVKALFLGGLLRTHYSFTLTSSQTTNTPTHKLLLTPGSRLQCLPVTSLHRCMQSSVYQTKRKKMSHKKISSFFLLCAWAVFLRTLAVLEWTSPPVNRLHDTTPGLGCWSQMLVYPFIHPPKPKPYCTLWTSQYKQTNILSCLNKYYEIRSGFLTSSDLS